ncbi:MULTISPECIES: type I secretion system permease/ATPase [unclassified Bradyrhizobium]|uniref:type I secretion system permease/ATPase n=1 Tax=unclassified Bradyrhizobium TaxID=2631580 RepID=UPI0007C6B800|nr:MULTISPECIES: type I secretion system permease/ATPase [unclassified Bradyrhizobium]
MDILRDDKDTYRPQLVAALVGIACLSALVSVLYLTGSLYMLEVYDRVLPSRSIPTLVGLSVIVAGLYAFQGFFDLMRSRLLVRLAGAVDMSLRRKTYEAVVQAPLGPASRSEGLQPLRDLDQIRTFLSSTGPAALFDLPWVPIYVLLCFAFHFWIGVVASIGAVLLLALTLTTELLSRRPTLRSASAAAAAMDLAEAAQRNAEVLRAMGMVPQMADVWEQRRDDHGYNYARVADVAGGLGAITKVVRLGLQSSVLATGALLVIQGEATGGIMIASSILLARALAPVELAIANWKGFVAARQSWSRLRIFLLRSPQKRPSIRLPPPLREISVDFVSLAAPGGERLLLRDINFSLSAGQVLAVVGPSGAGKSSLARALVGVWQAMRGRIRLDGAPLDQWSPDQLGRHIGYLPQDVELFEGTVAQNISRFSASANSEAIISAATAAGVHNLICSLPDGYDTNIGPRGTSLSAGQRQRVALARALFGDPFLVVLDEPNSSLDADGEAALLEGIRRGREKGMAFVIMAHRQSILAAVDRILVLGAGQMRAFGARDEVLKALRQGVEPADRAEQLPQNARTLAPQSGASLRITRVGT